MLLSRTQEGTEPSSTPALQQRQKECLELSDPQNRRRRNRWYVYTLAWPSASIYPNKVFYVGKGTKSRLFDHDEEAMQEFQSKKCDTIRAIWATGGQVQKTVLYETDRELDALIYEWVLINLIYGEEDLTNIQKATSVRFKVSASSSPSRSLYYTAAEARSVLETNEGGLINYIKNGVLSRCSMRGFYLRKEVDELAIETKAFFSGQRLSPFYREPINQEG